MGNQQHQQRQQQQQQQQHRIQGQRGSSSSAAAAAAAAPGDTTTANNDNDNSLGLGVGVRKRDFDSMNNSNNSNSIHNDRNNNGDDTMESLQQDLEEVEQTLEAHQQTHPNSIFHWGAPSASTTTTTTSTATSSRNETPISPTTTTTTASATDRLTNSGRAVFDSLGSALGSIRQRFQQLQQQQQRSSGSGSGTTPEGGGSASSTTAAAAVPTSAAASSDRRNPPPPPPLPRDFSERLETAERAHSNRVPLGMMRSYIRSASSSQSLLSMASSTDTTNHPSRNHHPGIGTEAAAAAAAAPTTSSLFQQAVDRKTSTGEESSGGGDDNNCRHSGPDDGGGGSSSTSSSSSPPSSPSKKQGGSCSSTKSRRRNSSTLVASRRYAEAQETNEMAVHEGVALLPPTTGSGIPEEEEKVDEEEQSDGRGDKTMETVPADSTIKDAVAVAVPMIETEPTQKRVADDDDDDDDDDDRRPATGFVLPAASIQKLDASTHQGNLLLSSVTSQDFSLWKEEAVATISATMQVPTVYAWGGGGGGGGGGGTSRAAEDFNLFGTTKSSACNQTRNDDSPPAQIPTDSRVGRSEIVSISLGETHAAVATATGSLLICGNNSEGAVDPTQRNVASLPRPMHLEPIMAMTTKVLQVACGLDHTAVLTENRSVLTFGNNTDGQLGHRIRRPTASGDAANQNLRFQSPAAMVLPRRAAQVVCGHRFTLVLTTRMEVYVCGREELTGYNTLDGQPPRLPEQNPALQGLPLVYVAAGPQHAVVLTAQGTAYAWGANPTGACGRGFPKTLTVPVPVQVPISSMEQPREANGRLVPAPFSNWAAWEVGSPNLITLADDVAVVDVACGKDTTILVTKTGRLLVAGSNDQWQLGLEDEKSEVFPVQTVEHPSLGVTFVSAEAGTNHTLLLDSKGDVWCMGNGTSMKLVLGGQSIASIAAGGTYSLAIASKKGDANPTINGLASKASATTPGLEGLLDGILLETEVSKQESAVEDLANQTEELFRCPAVINSVFLDPKEIDDLYGKLIMAAGTQKYRQRVVSAMEKGMIKGLESIKNARLMYPESVRCLLLYLQCPLFRAKEEGEMRDIRFDVRGGAILSLCESILGLPFEGYKAFAAWTTSLYAKELFVPFLVKPLMDQLDFMIKTESTRAVPVIVGVLRWFQNVAERFQNDVIAKPEDFYSTAVGELRMEALFDDLMRYKKSSKAARSVNFFLCASPFLMSPSTKRNLLQVENQLTMVQAAQTGGVQFDAARRQFLFQPYFVMAIDRQYMLQQTLQAVATAAPGELRKSLKVVFKGEDGVDAGGVTKEFFQLLVVQLFDINTGMWTTQFGDGINTWFNADCSWNQDGYYLVGVLVGLAVYNSVILDVHFPQAVYRKLLGLPLGLEDMVDPEVMRGLKALLEYQGDDVEDVFCLSFEVTWNSLGMERKKDLKPGGSCIPVTSDNREEYVMLYVKWLLVDSIQNQYDEFERGFMQVMDGSSLELLRPEELELLVVGTPELDFDALEANAEYEGGFDKDTPLIKNLWRFVKESPREAQLKFLKFTTGSTKAPIGGLGELPFKIQRAGPDSMQLPTSHTCFNTLLVPDYGDNYDKLAERLGRAIIECEGFGLQ